jgi:hypothetical protein
MLKEEIQEIYSVETTITKSKDKSHQEDSIYIIDFKSKDESKAHTAEESLKSLFDALATKILDDQAGNQISLEFFVQTLIDSSLLILHLLF